MVKNEELNRIERRLNFKPLPQENNNQQQRGNNNQQQTGNNINVNPNINPVFNVNNGLSQSHERKLEIENLELKYQ